MLAREGGGKKVDIPAHVGQGGRREKGRYSCPFWPGRGVGRQVDIPAHVGQGRGRETGRYSCPILAGEEGGQCLEENPWLVYSVFLKLLFYHQICKLVTTK